MGTWGTDIFSDDLAADVREEWLGAVADGATAEEATDSVVAAYCGESGHAAADPYERDVAYLALALTQWKAGRLVDSVRDAALSAVERGADPSRWQDPAQRAERALALAQAREQLLSPQPAATRIKRSARSATRFQPGDVIGYRHASGDWFLFWVMRNHADAGGEYSDVEVLDFVGPDLPGVADAAGLAAMQRRFAPRPDGRVLPSRGLGFLLTSADRIGARRAQVIGNVPRPPDRAKIRPVLVTPSQLDGRLSPFLPGGDHIL